MASALGNNLLNAATGIVAIALVLVAGIRVDEFLHPPSYVEAGDTSTVDDWEAYSIEGHRVGSPESAIKIVEFLDFRCPFCRTADQYLDSLLSDPNSDVSVVYRHSPFHVGSWKAALVAVCSSQLGVYRQVARELYRQADSLVSKDPVLVALEAGVTDTAALRECVAGERAAEIVARDTAAASQLGVRGTPTFLINGLKVSGFSNPRDMDALIELVRSR